MHLKDKQSDYVFWQTRSYKERLEAIELLRSQYIKFDKMFSQDFKEFVELLSKHNASYLCVSVFLIQC